MKNMRDILNFMDSFDTNTESETIEPPSKNHLDNAGEKLLEGLLNEMKDVVAFKKVGGSYEYTVKDSKRLDESTKVNKSSFIRSRLSLLEDCSKHLFEYDGETMQGSITIPKLSVDTFNKHAQEHCLAKAASDQWKTRFERVGGNPFENNNIDLEKAKEVMSDQVQVLNKPKFTTFTELLQYVNPSKLETPVIVDGNEEQWAIRGETTILLGEFLGLPFKCFVFKA